MRISWMVAGLAMLLATPLNAAERAGTSDRRAEMQTLRPHWYGVRMLALDVASWTAGVIGYEHDVSILETAGFAIGLLGGPAVHHRHGHEARSTGSLALRGLGAIVSFAYVKRICLEPCPPRHRPKFGRRSGIIFLVLEEAFDDIVLARENAPAHTARLVDEPLASSVKPTGAHAVVRTHWAPSLRWNPSGAQLQLMAHF